jgi:hypothetical protein
MKKMLAISVFALCCNNVMGSQDSGIRSDISKMEVIGANYLSIKKPEGYLPREFWDNTETVRNVLNEVLPEAEERAYNVLYGPDAKFNMLPSYTVELIYPKIQIYMEDRGLSYPNESEIFNSIGLIPLSYYRNWTPESSIDWTDEDNRVEQENSETFLDYVGSILGKPLSARADNEL